MHLHYDFLHAAAIVLHVHTISRSLANKQQRNYELHTMMNDMAWYNFNTIGANTKSKKCSIHAWYNKTRLALVATDVTK